MRIAYVCADRGIPFLGGKGASVHCREITTALAGRGHSVNVLCARVGAGNRMPPVATVSQYETGPELEAALGVLAAADGIDVVLERYSLESGFAREMSRTLGLPLVLEVNAPLVLEAGRWRGLVDVDAHLASEQATFRDADAIVAVSSALVEYVTRVAPHARVRRVANGANVGRFQDARLARAAERDRDEVVVGFSGSMKPWHGVHELLEAFRRIARDHLAVGLVFAGHGPEERPLRERVAERAELDAPRAVRRCGGT